MDKLRFKILTLTNHMIINNQKNTEIDKIKKLILTFLNTNKNINSKYIKGIQNYY